MVGRFSRFYDQLILTISILLPMLASGCSALYSYTNNEDNLERLSVPMSKGDVVKALGKPDRVLHDDERITVWEYGLYDRNAWRTELLMLMPTLYLFTMNPTHPYHVILVNNQLCMWGPPKVVETRKSCVEPIGAEAQSSHRSTLVSSPIPQGQIAVTPIPMPPTVSVPVSRLAVIPLAEPASGNVATLLDTVLNILRTRHPQLVLVERDLGPVTEEVALQHSGRVDDGTAVRVGNLVGADTILTYRGWRTSDGWDISFELKLVHVETGSLLFRQTATAMLPFFHQRTASIQYDQYAQQREAAIQEARLALRARGLDEGYLFEMTEIAKELMANDPDWFRLVPYDEQIDRIADRVIGRIKEGIARRGSIELRQPDDIVQKVWEADGYNQAAVFVLAALVSAFGDNPLGIVPDLTVAMDGVTVLGVLQGSPAHVAGIRVKDRIISLNGQPFTSWIVPITLPAALTIEREGKRQEVKVLNTGGNTE